jgi:uncharacterized protein (TIGR00156 family)
MNTAENPTLATLARPLRPLFAAFAAIPLLIACASTPPAEMSIANALAAPDGTELVITGAVVQQFDDERVLLRDPSGQITAEIDDSLLGEVKLAPNSRLRIHGEIDRDSERSVLVAETVQVLQ